jgi:hypothetical protein
VPLNLSEELFGQVRRIDAIPILLDLYKLSNEPTFIDDRYNKLSRMVLDALSQIATTSESAYKNVKDEVLNFINMYKGKYANVNFLYMFLEKLERKYYLSKSEQLTIPQIQSKISIMFPESN